MVVVLPRLRLPHPQIVLNMFYAGAGIRTVFSVALGLFGIDLTGQRDLAVGHRNVDIRSIDIMIVRQAIANVFADTIV